MAGITVEKLPQFDVMYNLPPDINTVVIIGGRGGAKTYEVSKWTAFSATIKRKRCVVLRDEKSLIRESILNEILQRFDTANTDGILGRFYERMDAGLKDKTTGDMAVFTKGFRASKNDKKANMKSISNIDIAVIEEAEDIRDPDKYNTFKDGIRKEGAIVVIVLNTPDINHWIVKRWFNTELVEDGYWRLIPKVLPGFLCINTNYEDNPYLPAHIRASYEAYNDPDSPTYNPHYYKTEIKGYASSGRKGQIHKKIRPIKLQEYMELPYPEMYGQDFGTASHAGTIGTKIYKNTSWARQLNYPPMSTLGLGKLYCGLGFTAKDKIVADNADKTAWEKLSAGWSEKELSDEDWRQYPALRRGFYMVPSKKGPDSLESGLALMDGLSLFAVEESVDLWKEIQNRIYNLNKMGEYTNDPAPGFDHLMDPWMYVLVEVFGSERGKKRGLKNKSGYFR